MNHTICIAGKNQIAIDGLNYLLTNYPNQRIVFLPNSTDTGIDSWQPSFLSYGRSRMVDQVTLSEIYSVPDLIFLSLEFDKIINPEKFITTELFNIHFSLLPKYKGMFTSALPILNGDTTSGVTLHKIDTGIDTGDIIDQIEFSIDIHDNARDLYFKYLNYSRTLLINNIKNIIEKNYRQTQQSAIGSTYFSRKSIDYSNLIIDFNKSAFEIHNQIRAFSFREYQTPKFREFEISHSKFTKNKSIKRPGEIVEEFEDHFTIASVDYNINLYKDFYPILWQAATDNNITILCKAIRFIPDINLLNKNGWSALAMAVYNGNISAVEMLIKCGASLSTTNYKGTTILMYAFSFYEKTGDDEIFRFLLTKGANYLAKDKSGKNLSDYMKERKNTDLLKLIEI